MLMALKVGNIPYPGQFFNSIIVNEYGQIEVTQAPNPEFMLWTCYDQFLMSWLLSSTSKSMLGHIMHC